jgi:hypothetical protein
MKSPDRNARRDLGALYAALTVKSFASGLTPAARKRAIFPAEFATNERAERFDERIEALQRNYRTRFSRSPGEPAISRVEELAQEFRSRLTDVLSDTSSGNLSELRDAAEAAMAASMAAYGNAPKTADLRNEIVNGIKPYLIPLRASGSTVKSLKYVDFGFTSAREFWDEVVLPAYECFKAEPTRGKAIMASFAAWHIQDWIWHQQHPGEDTRRSKDYQPFQEKLFLDCPELPWIRDVADAGKHRGLGRQKPKVEVREVKGTRPRNVAPLIVTLDDGTQHDFADVLGRVIEFWRAKYFP